ncbi:MAG: M55 family metallopeptidase [Clostridia bacterium]|nr:M55 family metallopeptidase [Clostridia bacterium]
MNYLIAVDLEGAHGVVGEPYKGLSPTLGEYRLAVENVTKEVNAAIAALYDSGASGVYVWDNHGNLDNLDFTKVDSRAKKIKPISNSIGRLDFCKEYSFAGMVLIGYHAREGRRNGVLAHTYSSADIQYYKLGGKPVGEYDIDGAIAASFGVPTVFLSSDDACAADFSENFPTAITAVTKLGKGRNEAEFLPVEEVLESIYCGVKKAVKAKISPIAPVFPTSIEVRYTRTEYAAKIFEKLSGKGLSVDYGEDAHILIGTVKNVDELRTFL